MINRWILTPRQRFDLEMILIGGFSPLSGFLSKADYEHVLSDRRLSDGNLWPIPVTLDVSDEFAQKVNLGDKIGLYDCDNTLLAHMTITDKWQPDKTIEAQNVFQTEDLAHPAVSYLFNKAGSWYLGGPVQLVSVPRHFDFLELRYSPAALKLLFSQLGWKKIIGFQTRNPIHRAHMELTLRATEEVGGHVLLHPVVGLTKPGDIEYFTRVRCYQKLLHHYPKQQALLSLLPLAMRMGGPREALWHALIRKNYGCTHFIVGRDHAGPGKNSKGKPFYDPYEAQELVGKYQHEIGIHMISFQEMVYVKERNRYITSDEVQPHESALTISGTQLRDMLSKKESIPEWFSFPEVIEELSNAYQQKHQQGFTVFFTGLSGSGKTTLAKALYYRLMSYGKRNITLLDGDVTRRVLATELGFSKEDRNLNIQRLGFVAAEVTKVGGIAICSAIAPYQNQRAQNRELIREHGGYIEVYLSTSLIECEKRDAKGLYAKVRKGELKHFTGIDDPYEAPLNPEITIDTESLSIEKSVETIIDYLQQVGYLKIMKYQQAALKEAV